jgi:spermidine synthase
MNTAYPFIPVTIIIFAAYFITWLFSRWEIFSIKSNRKFWNVLLLVTFLVAGLLGILSVVKINYKLVIPGYEKFIQWHVSFGIAMVFISFFHLSWHLKYYFTFNKKTQSLSKEDSTKIPDSSSAKIRLSLLILGMLAIISQLVFIREFISVLSGNELVLGIVMAIWMLLTGWGAWQGRKGNFARFSPARGIQMLAALSIMPIFLIGLLYWLKSLLFPPGTMVGVGTSVIATILVLLPVCFLSGYLFTWFSTHLSESKNKNLAGKAYAIESLGSLLGGLVFSFILGRFFTSFQIFGITSAATLLAGTWICRTEKQKLNLKFIIPAVLIPIAVFMLKPDNFIKKMMFPNQELLVNKSTRYGNLVVTQQAGQLNVYENNELQFYTQNVMLNEEAVHFAMVQHQNPRKILLVSGGISGMIKEIEKYRVEKITYLETNPEIFSSLVSFSDSLPRNVEIVKKDIRSFIGKTDEQYDVVLLNLPPPSSLGMNRFYTLEFFQLLKKHCNDKTVICTSLPASANYTEANAINVNASLWNTLGNCYQKRLLLTGEKNYFLASDGQLTPEIAEQITMKGIENEYVNQYYIDDKLLSMRSQTLTRQLKDDVPLNRDFYPYMFIKQISHWLSYFGTNYKILVLIPLLLFLLGFLRLNRVTAGLYTGGFTAGSLEVVLLLAYQVWFGSIYLATAFFFAVFMAGLAFGSSGYIRFNKPLIQRYYLLQFALAGFAVLLPLLINLLGEVSFWRIPSQMIFFVLIFSLASAIGQEFLMATKISQSVYSKSSGISYSTDLAGSAFGAFLTAIVLLPLAGITITCFVVAGLNILSGTMAFSVRKTL